MRVEYLGHACFLLADNNFTLIIDPFKEIGYDCEIRKSDFCVCSHLHYDHCATDRVLGCTIIDDSNISLFNWIKAIPSFHDEVNGSIRGKNLIHIVNGSYTVCHLGDLGMPYNEDLCRAIGDVDILLIPVGGKYTIDSNEAKKYVQGINPKIVIPMHYKTKKSDIDISKKDAFIRGYTNIVKSDTVINITELPDEMIIYDIIDDNF